MLNRIFIVFFAFLLSLGSCDQNSTIIPKDTYWELANPEQLGFNSDTLQKIINDASGLSNFYALLVIRNNKLIVEEYFHQKTANDLFHLRSITKNFTSALTGIAIHEKILDSVDLSVKSFYPDLIIGDKELITIRHLLNMTSGLEWNEGTEIESLLLHQIPSPVESLLSRTLVSAPGSEFNYNTVSPHVISHLISQKQSQNFNSYAEEKLFTPLGIEDYQWEEDSENEVWGGTGLQITARDLAKFGQLYLNGGSWTNNQILPEDWVSISKNKQLTLPGSSTGYSQCWWISENLNEKVFYGQGYGGQALMLIPEKELMIIGLQEHMVTNQQHTAQWSAFLNKLFYPIYHAAN